MKKISLVMLALVLFAGISFSADKNSSSSAVKLGLGYSKISVNLGNGQGLGNVSLDQVAGRFWFSDNLGIDVSLGFKAGDAQTAILLGGSIIGKFIKVNKLDIYWLAGIAFGSYDPKVRGTNSLTVFRVKGGVGAEYYVLPCLSVLTEMGIAFQSASGNGNSFNDFGIFADWLPQAGIRYYF